jgi:outer membrane protein TolC
MKTFLVITLLGLSFSVPAQTVAKMPDSIRRMVDEYNGLKRPNSSTVSKTAYTAEDIDQRIKDKLVKLALKNDEITTADANIKIAEINRKKANSSLLSSINLGGNVNEFVVNNSPQANFFPKYNLQLAVPLDIFAKNKQEKRVADQNIVIANAQKMLLQKNIKSRVLILYATYKENKLQVELQKIANEEDITAYENAQKDFKDDVISLEQLNKIYRGTILEKAVLAEKEKNLDIATIQLEEIIGVSIKTVIP